MRSCNLFSVLFGSEPNPVATGRAWTSLSPGARLQQQFPAVSSWGGPSVSPLLVRFWCFGFGPSLFSSQVRFTPCLSVRVHPQLCFLPSSAVRTFRTEPFLLPVQWWAGVSWFCWRVCALSCPLESWTEQTFKVTEPSCVGFYVVSFEVLLRSRRLQKTSELA